MLCAHALCVVVVMVLAAGAAWALRDVRLVLPPVARAGGSVSLLCLFDMESAPLYAVKWYRGNRELYRFTPGDRPQQRVFPFPGVVVDLSASSKRQLTLRSVPPHLSGAFSCEVSADAPSFSTATVSGNLTIIDFPDIKVNSTLMDDGETLTVNCTYPVLKQRTSLTFYVNNEPAPQHLVQEWSGGASLRFSALSRAWGREGREAGGVALRLRCVMLVDDRFPAPSNEVSVWVPLRLTPPPPPAPPSPPPQLQMPPEEGHQACAVRRASAVLVLLLCALQQLLSRLHLLLAGLHLTGAAASASAQPLVRTSQR